MEDTIVERVPHKAQLKEGLYDAVIMRVEAQKDVQTNYGVKDMIIVTFDIEGVEIRRRYNKSWNIGSNLHKLVSELRPNEVATMKYDVAKLEGMKVRVLIGHNKTDDGGEWDNILTVTKFPTQEPIAERHAATPAVWKSEAETSLEELGNDPELTRDI